MENLNLLTPGGFVFFLLILMFGYIIVEILWGENYIFRKSIERYNNSWINRLFHYIFWGMFGNFLFLLTYTISGKFESVTNLYNSGAELANLLSKIYEINPGNTQLVIFSIQYFISILIIIIFIYFVSIIFGKSLIKFEETFKYFKKSKKIKKKTK